VNNSGDNDEDNNTGDIDNKGAGDEGDMRDNTGDNDDKDSNEDGMVTTTTTMRATTRMVQVTTMTTWAATTMTRTALMTTRMAMREIVGTAAQVHLLFILLFFLSTVAITPPLLCLSHPPSTSLSPFLSTFPYPSWFPPLFFSA
jgi:hypothetical protein